MRQLPLYLSRPENCNYLPGQHSRSAFIDPRVNLDASSRAALLRLGFRRSGDILYRPACADCQACESVRVDVQNFQYTRAQKRCLKRNADLSWEVRRPEDDDERYALYQKYLAARHPDGGMEPDDREAYRRFLCVDLPECTHHLYRLDGELVGVAVADRLEDGWSAIYSYFDPDLDKRSLGRYLVLNLLKVCEKESLSWLYLGYWIRDCQKMSYKAEYQPQQRWLGGDWQETSP